MSFMSLIIWKVHCGETQEHLGPREWEAAKRLRVNKSARRCWACSPQWGGNIYANDLGFDDCFSERWLCNHLFWPSPAWSKSSSIIPSKPTWPNCETWRPRPLQRLDGTPSPSFFLTGNLWQKLCLWKLLLLPPSRFHYFQQLVSQPPMRCVWFFH